jgi:DNA replication protein DnaC
LITGATGVGKSYLASALGHQACLLGYRTLYFNTQKLFSRLKMLKADGSYSREISKIERADLVILDDFGMQPLDSGSRMIFLEIIEDRHGQRSTLIGSQLPVSKWYEIRPTYKVGQMGNPIFCQFCSGRDSLPDTTLRQSTRCI